MGEVFLWTFLFIEQGITLIDLSTSVWGRYDTLQGNTRESRLGRKLPDDTVAVLSAARCGAVESSLRHRRAHHRPANGRRGLR